MNHNETCCSAEGKKKGFLARWIEKLDQKLKQKSKEGSCCEKTAEPKKSSCC